MCGNSKFFESENLPRIYFASEVVASNTNYYSKFTKEDYDKFNNDYETLKQKYIEKKQKNENVSDYLRVLFELKLVQIILRRRHFDKKSDILPYTGACIPGMKLNVRVDGKIDICERINQTFSIGNIDSGLNYDSIKEIINLYRNSIMQKCSKCIAQLTCPVCFANSAKEHEFALNSDSCSNWIKRSRDMLEITYSILEKNPRAFDNITKDLEQSIEFNF